MILKRPYKFTKNWSQWAGSGKQWTNFKSSQDWDKNIRKKYKWEITHNDNLLKNNLKTFLRTNPQNWSLGFLRNIFKYLLPWMKMSAQSKKN